MQSVRTPPLYKLNLGHAYQLCPYNRASPTIFDKGQTIPWRRRERDRGFYLPLKLLTLIAISRPEA